MEQFCKGDIVVCTNKHWLSFTHGKEYEVINHTRTVSTSLMSVLSDKGGNCLPCYTSIKFIEDLEDYDIVEDVNGNKVYYKDIDFPFSLANAFRSKTKCYNFLSKSEWTKLNRKEKLKKLL